MTDRRLLQSNILANIGQMLATAALLLLLYRIIISNCGVSALGIWSVVAASTSAVKIADFGMGASATMYVARHLAQGDDTGAISAIKTALTTSAIMLSGLLVLAYPVLMYVFDSLFDAQELSIAYAILPFAAVSFLINSLSAVLMSSIDGCQRIRTRAMIVISGNVVLVAATYILVKPVGIAGAAMAQFIQAIFLLITSLVFLRRFLPALPLFSFGWNGDQFKAMFGYGAKVQLSAIAMMVFDPLTKIALAKYGGAQSVGYFEIASQVVLRMRSFIGAANQSMIPHVARQTITDGDSIPAQYDAALGLTFYFTIISFTAIWILHPIIYWILGSFASNDLDFMFLLLTIVWGINALCIPAYYFNMGTGAVGTNAKHHILMSLINICLVFVSGMVWGWKGVVYCYAASILAGSIYLFLASKYKSKATRVRLRPEDLLLTFTAVGSGLVGGSLAWDSSLRPAAMGMGMALLLAGAWLHPLRQHLWTELLVAIRSGGK
jgi:O-antigen/teichoic acid export membrane protein